MQEQQQQQQEVQPMPQIGAKQQNLDEPIVDSWAQDFQGRLENFQLYRVVRNGKRKLLQMGGLYTYIVRPGSCRFRVQPNEGVPQQQFHAEIFTNEEYILVCTERDKINISCYDAGEVDENFPYPGGAILRVMTVPSFDMDAQHPVFVFPFREPGKEILLAKNFHSYQLCALDSNANFPPDEPLDVIELAVNEAYEVVSLYTNLLFVLPMEVENHPPNTLIAVSFRFLHPDEPAPWNEDE